MRNKFYCLFILLIIPCIAIAELKDGFRDLKWGDAPIIGEMKKIYDNEKTSLYVRESDKLFIENIPLNSIAYIFYENHFSYVDVRANKKYYGELVSILKKEWGNDFEFNGGKYIWIDKKFNTMSEINIDDKTEEVVTRVFSQKNGQLIAKEFNEKTKDDCEAINKNIFEKWNDNLTSTYKEFNKRREDDGNVKSIISFNDKKALAFLLRDACKRERFFYSNIYSMDFVSAIHSKNINSAVYIKNYILLKDGEEPLFILNPIYESYVNWMNIHKLSIIVDGKILLENNLIPSKVTHEKNGIAFVEKYLIICDENCLSKLRKISNKSNLAIKIYGNKIHYVVDKKNIEYFKKEILNSLAVFDIINKAVESHATGL